MDVQSVGNSNSASITTALTGTARPEPKVDTQRLPDSNSSGEVRAVENQGTAYASREAQHQQVEDAVKSVREFVGATNRGIQFSIDNDTHKTVVKVIDIETKDVIRQIPSEEMLAIAKALDRLQGLLVRNKA